MTKTSWRLPISRGGGGWWGSWQWGRGWKLEEGDEDHDLDYNPNDNNDDGDDFEDDVDKEWEDPKYDPMNEDADEGNLNHGRVLIRIVGHGVDWEPNEFCKFLCSTLRSI